MADDQDDQDYRERGEVAEVPTPAKPQRMGFERAESENQGKLGDCLWDAHAAGAKILEFTARSDYEEFAESELLRSAVAQMLRIVADALVEMRQEFPEEYRKLDGADRVLQAGQGGGAIPATLWRVVEEDLPGFVASAQTGLDAWHQG